MEEMYTTRGVIQEIINDYYMNYGTYVNFLDAVVTAYNKKLYTHERPNLSRDTMWGFLTDEEFVELLNQLPIYMDIFINPASKENILEQDIVPEDSDVFVLKLFNYISDHFHKHNFFEVLYVFDGSCLFEFEERTIILNEGEICIIAPYSLHKITIDNPDSVVISILIRKSTFESSFFPLLSQKDLLSYFFRNLLYHQSDPNYLLFVTDNPKEIKTIVKNLVMENYMDDSYFNNCCISWINIFFSIILRKYSHTIQFYNYKSMETNFSLILQYIQKHYRTLTLKELADYFHYSEAHLSTLIKKNTGHKFSTLVTKLKMADAYDYLTKTDMSIKEISDYVGYNSTDHFSRTFKKYYGESPNKFRQNTQKRYRNNS